MPSIPFIATVSDPTGKQREFNVPVALSKKQADALRTGGQASVAVLKHTVEIAQATMLAEKWSCTACTRRATRMVNTPAFCPTPSDGIPCVVDYTPLPICDQPLCNQAATREAQKRLQMLRGELAEEEPGGEDFFAAQRFSCAFCNTVKNGTSAKLQSCARCRAVWYCGRACQVAHWKAGHKHVCVPVDVSDATPAPAPSPGPAPAAAPAAPAPAPGLAPPRQGREQRHDTSPGNPWATLYAAKAAQHLQEAGKAAQAGAWRASADAYLEAMTAAPRTWEQRWYAFSGFTSLVASERRFPPTEHDLKALRAVACDENEPPHFRCEAEFSIGLARWEARDREGAARHYRTALEVAGAASAQERAARTHTSWNDANSAPSLELRTVGEILDRTAANARKNLSILENPRPREVSPPSLRADGTAPPATAREMNVSADTEHEALEMLKRLSVGGAVCDACGEPADEGARLLSCSRCKMAYYCSAECQKAQWKKGHKQACRAPGQIEPGDDMRLAGLASRPELNDKIVQVVRPVAEREGRWQVRLRGRGQEQSLCVAAEKLGRLRPAC